MGRTRQWSEQTVAVVFWVGVIVVVVAAWIWWPQVSAVLSHRPAGAPERGADCREVDWDEWGRPLYECRRGSGEYDPLEHAPDVDPPRLPPPAPELDPRDLGQP